MAILTFEIPVEKGRPYSINIHNWRYMANVNYNYGNRNWTQGTRIILTDDMVDVMGYTPQMLHEIIHRDDIVENAIFTSSQGWHSGYCHICGGSGKLDWVSAAMTRPRPHPSRNARLFKRDEKRVMFYKKDSSSQRFEFGKVFAPTKLDRSEKRCINCHGTGLWLDARLRIFNGMPHLKHSIEEFEWNGINLP